LLHLELQQERAAIITCGEKLKKSIDASAQTCLGLSTLIVKQRLKDYFPSFTALWSQISI